MIINILPDELEPEFRESWKMGFITQPSIDYADNAIWADKEGDISDLDWVNGMKSFFDHLISEGKMETYRIWLFICN